MRYCWGCRVDGTSRSMAAHLSDNSDRQRPIWPAYSESLCACLQTTTSDFESARLETRRVVGSRHESLSCQSMVPTAKNLETRMMSFRGQVALVTGGGSGIGAATAERLALD